MGATLLLLGTAAAVLAMAGLSCAIPMQGRASTEKAKSSCIEADNRMVIFGTPLDGARQLIRRFARTIYSAVSVPFRGARKPAFAGTHVLVKERLACVPLTPREGKADLRRPAFRTKEKAGFGPAFLFTPG